jgi:excisionase family DNA binding protein
MRLRRPSVLAHGSPMALTAPQIENPAVGVPARIGLTRDQVMTAGEVADLLHLPVSTVYYLARRGQIPACRLGRTWRFLRPRIEELLGS